MTVIEFVAAYPKRHRVDALLGLVRQCSKCEEWWSATAEFFMGGHRGDPLRLHSWCKACYREYRRELREERKVGAV